MIKNIIANFIGRTWGVLSNFLFIPLYIKFLGFENYSIISFTLVIAGLMSVLDVGLTSALSREFARVDNSLAERIKIFRTLESSYLILTGMVILIVFFSSEFLATHFQNLNSFSHDKVKLFIRIVSLDVCFQLLLRFYTGGLLGLERQIIANVNQVGWGVLRNGMVVIAIVYVPTLEMFFVWQSLSTIAFAIILRLTVCKALTGKYLDFNFELKISVYKRVWRFAGGMLLISLVAAMNTQMDKLAISKYLPIENLGYYTLAVSLATGIIVVVNPISVSFLPRFTNLYTSGKVDDAAVLFYRVQLLATVLVFSIMINMGLYAKNLVWIWTGNMDLAEHVYKYLPVVSASFAMLALQILPYTIAIANGHTKLNNIIGLISLFVTIPGYWFVTKLYGVTGVAILFFIVQTLTTLVYTYFVNKLFLNNSELYNIYFKRLLIPLIITMGIGFLVSLIVIDIKENRLLLLAWICLSTAITFVLSVYIILSRNDMQSIIAILMNRKHTT